MDLEEQEIYENIIQRIQQEQNEYINNEMSYKLGDILEVRSLDGEIHYEKVTELLPEILTEDMCENEIEDISVQGLSDNYVYRILPNFEIVKALNQMYL